MEWEARPDPNPKLRWYLTRRRRGIPYHTRLLAEDHPLAGGAGNGCPDHTPRKRNRSRDLWRRTVRNVRPVLSCRWSIRAGQTRSRIIAIPWPTPMHIVHKA
jgi:hypothetical protein